MDFSFCTLSDLLLLDFWCAQVVVFRRLISGFEMFLGPFNSLVSDISKPMVRQTYGLRAGRHSRKQRKPRKR